jgi:hypothetical protein
MFKVEDDMEFEATLDYILYGPTDFQRFEIATGMFDSYEISKNQVILFDSYDMEFEPTLDYII